ncbi:MAG: hypothetical protein ACI9WU_003266 [Myxococcota bacterium]|jgi:hypothetical protein
MQPIQIKQLLLFSALALALASALVLVSAIAGCDVPPSDVDCENADPPEGFVTQGPSVESIRADLTVRGTSDHPSGLTIRTIEVMGMPATNDGFNHDRWSAILAFEELLALSKANLDSQVEVLVEATDVCGAVAELGRFSIVVDEDPKQNVTALSLQHTISSGESFLPANGKVPAVLNIFANPEAAGAEVKLAANIGSFGGAADSGIIVLGGDGVTDATATVLFTGDTAGIALVTATSEDHVASTQITVAGAPALVPSAGSLIGGQTIRVTVFTDGVIESCQATPTLGMTVISGESNLMGLPGAEDVNGDGKIDIDISAEQTLDEEITLTVSCIDVYGQAAAGEYVGVPLPAVLPNPDEPDVPEDTP